MSTLYAFKINHDGCIFDNNGMEVYGLNIASFDSVIQPDGAVALVEKLTPAQRLQQLLPDSIWAKAGAL